MDEFKSAMLNFSKVSTESAKKNGRETTWVAKKMDQLQLDIQKERLEIQKQTEIR